MLGNKQQQSQYVIKVVSRDNPLQIKLPIISGHIQTDQHSKTLTIDAASFVATKLTTTPANFISASSQYVQIMFGNGSGCFDKDGRMTKTLQVMECTTQVVTSTYTRKKWFLSGSADPYVWSTGHDLQIGFANVSEIPIDFSAAGLDTDYILIIKVQMN